ncbi:MAG: TonB-dependent receptor [Bryobacteraceae bacterium]|nr:TonB-dependent receptor [Bryobacterales bacterium]NUN00576.1 TonB-dependent receptor [Bryobacteraceae bacterium]
MIDLARILLLAVLLTTCVLVSSGQTNTAQLTGIVTDTSGAVVPDTKITVTNVDTGIGRTTVSNAAGLYTVPVLNPGNYRIKVEQRGFRPVTRSGIALHANQAARIDFVLDVGEAKESILVTADAPLLQNESATLGDLVNQEAVQDLPLNGRNFINLAQLTAGANEGLPNAITSGNRPDERRRTSTVSINGQVDVVNNFLIDGMDNNERGVGTIVVKPSIDAIREFKVLTNVYAAEFGRTAGGIINLVTQSGTNEIHGSLFEFFRNDKLDAKNFFDSPIRPIPPLRQNQYGGSIGGPVSRNRTFFFGDFEAFKSRRSDTFLNTIPTEQMKSGDFAGIKPIFDPLSIREDPAQPDGFLRTRFPADLIPASRLSPIALKYVDLYPTAQIPALANNYLSNAVKKEDSYTTDIRLDHGISQNDLFYARYSFNHTGSLIPGPLPRKGDIEPGGSTNYVGPATQVAQGLHLNYVHIVSPQMVAELKGGYSRYSIATLPPNYGKNVSQEFGIPNANLDLLSSGLTLVTISGYLPLGDSGSIPINVIDNTFQYLGSLTYSRDRHTIKAGADFRRCQYTKFNEPSGRGLYSFNSNFTNDPSGAVPRSGDAMASFLLGFPHATQRYRLLVWPGLRMSEVAAYVQDDWKVSSSLTLNLGVRWELFTPVTEVADRIGNIDLAAGKLLVAGKDGVSRTAGVPTDWKNIAPRFGFAWTMSPSTVLRGGYGITWVPAIGGSISSMATPPFTSSLAVSNTPLTPTNSLSDGFPLPIPDSTDPLLVSGGINSASLDRKTPKVQQYNLTLQQKVAANVMVSASYVGALSRNQWNVFNVNLASPGPGPIAPRRQYAKLFPNLSNIRMHESTGTGNYHALQMNLEHRMSRGLNLSANYTWAHSIDDNIGVSSGGKPSAGPYPQLSTNRSLERGNSDLDIRHRFVVLSNYALPFGNNLRGVAGVLGKGWQINGVLVLQSGQSFTVSNSSSRANTGGGDRPNRVGVGTLPNPTIHRYIDAAAFELQPLYQIGNAGRNILYGPSQKGLDCSVFKEFALRERMQLQFRTEFFNLTNTPKFSVPNGSFGTAAFGTINSTGNSTSRQIQFALKLLF